MSSKRFVPLLLVALGCQWSSLLAPAARAASGSSDGTLEVGFFYDTLKDEGSWFNTTEYGDVWQPYIAYKSDAWRPYTDGYWTYTDGGWMFVSYENFGWAVYHYGRWTQLKDIGWAWVPGTDWSPAWVTWRESTPSGGENGQPAATIAATSTDADRSTPPPSVETSGASTGDDVPAVSQNYIGWAPLPPEPADYVYTENYAYGPSVDIDYGIDPYDYCFTDVRSFGAPYLGAVLFDPGRSYYCAERSVNVTNIYYNRQGAYRGFYNDGPRYDRFNGVTERQIPRFNLRREQGSAAREAVRAARFNQVNGNNLNVVAPRFSQRNVRNGRVSFKDRGALPVSQVNRERPAAQASPEVRERARNAFRQQGEDFRAKNPKSQSARRAVREAARQQRVVGQPGGMNPAGTSGITQTPRARQEERTARQAARREAKRGENPAQPGPNSGGQGPNPNAGRPLAANNPAAAATQERPRTERKAARQEARRQANAAARAQGGGGTDVATRQQARQARQAARQEARASRPQAPSVPREARQPRGGGGGRAFRGGEGSGGGGRAMRTGDGGGGGHQPGAGGGERRGGGGGGGEKKGDKRR